MSAPPGPASKSRLINDLEVLRGFGLCVVIFHHLQGSLVSKTLFTEGPWPAYAGGGAVLDLFFCISGFIITRNLSDYKNSPVPAISPAAFLKRIG